MCLDLSAVSEELPWKLWTHNPLRNASELIFPAMGVLCHVPKYYYLKMKISLWSTELKVVLLVILYIVLSLIEKSEACRKHRPQPCTYDCCGVVAQTKRLGYEPTNVRVVNSRDTTHAKADKKTGPQKGGSQKGAQKAPSYASKNAMMCPNAPSPSVCECKGTCKSKRTGKCASANKNAK